MKVREGSRLRDAGSIDQPHRMIALNVVEERPDPGFAIDDPSHLAVGDGGAVPVGRYRKAIRRGVAGKDDIEEPEQVAVSALPSLLMGVDVVAEGEAERARMIGPGNSRSAHGPRGCEYRKGNCQITHPLCHIVL